MLLLYKEGGESAVALYSRRGECCCSIKEMMKNMPGKAWLSPPPPLIVCLVRPVPELYHWQEIWVPVLYCIRLMAV